MLSSERRTLERAHGRLSNAEFLQIVSDPVRYGWLKPLTGLVLALDPHEDDDPVDVPEQARELLVPPKSDTPFGRRYLSLMQRDPELVMAHSALARLL